MKLLLHICCANCAVYPAKILGGEGHSLTGFWFNPNIHPFQEYRLRLDSLKLLADRHIINDIYYLEEYKPSEFFKILSVPYTNSNYAENPESPEDFSRLIENAPSPHERCRSCYTLRLEKTAEQASREGFDAFSTTLLISPYQDFEQISATGHHLADKYNILFHMRDFRPYFRDSMNAAKEFGFYRQKYCGCFYSKEERLKKNQKSNIKYQNFGRKIN